MKVLPKVMHRGEIVEVKRLRNTGSANPRWRITWVPEGSSRAEWMNTVPDHLIGHIIVPDVLLHMDARIATTRDGIVSVEVVNSDG